MIRWRDMKSQIPKSSKIAMTMRKIGFIAALVVAMTAVSCVQEMNTEIPAPETSAVTFDATFDASATKAVLDGTTGKVAWEAGDQVNILVDEGNYLYTAAQAGATTYLTTEAEDVPTEGTYYALFPYDADAALADGVITTALPAEQTAVLGSFTTHLAVAQTTDTKLAFKNVCGLVKVNVSAENVTKIVFEGNNEEIVAGDIEVTVSDTPSWERLGGDPDPDPDQDPDLASLASVRSTPVASTSVTLVPAEGQTILAKGDYYFAVLPQTFTNGFKVTAYKGDKASVIRNVITEVVIARAGMIAGKSFGIDGSGTEEDPYILKTPQDMVDMRSLAKLGGETWFKMANDIDMKGIDWVPVNYDQYFERKIHFDGGNFTISNLTCDKKKSGGDYASLFGVLYGSCVNLKIDKAVITSTSGCGVLGGYVGTTGLPAIVENVTITNSSVTNAGAATGGVCGNAREAMFTNVSFQGTVTGAGQDTGGFVGKLSGTYNEFNNCTVKATVVTTYAGNARCGGFIGWNSSTATTITDCQVLDGSTLTHNGALSKVAETTCGGFIGYGDLDGVTLTITGCSADVDVDAGEYGQMNSCFIGRLAYASTVTITDSYATGTVEGSQNYFGGMIGCMSGTNNTTITNCHFSGKVKGASGVGGLVGAVENTAVLTVTESSATGTVTNTANNCGGLVGLVSNSVEVTDSHFDGNIVVSGYAGGIVGGTGTSASKCKISRSYSTGTLAASKAYCGGIFGVSQGVASGMVVEDCWSSMILVVTGQQCGGIVGTTLTGITIKNCFASGYIESKTSGNAGIIGRVAKSSTISGCIAWNENLVCGRTAYDKYAPGAIAGCAQEAGTYANCWRRADMTLTDPFVSLWDQPDYVNAMPPLPSYSSATHQQSYHGKAAGAEETLSQVASRIGWSEDIWDLSGDVPALK